MVKDTNEKRFKELLSANDESKRANWAHDYKQTGKKVIGLLDSYVPEEIISAAGMLPWRITGTWQESVPLATVYRPMNTEPFCNHVLESLLRGDLEFLDGVITTNWDDDRRQLYDVWAHVKKTPFVHIMHLPRRDDHFGLAEFSRQLFILRDTLTDFFSVEISDSALSEAIALHEETRSLLKTVYDLRKRDFPPLSGSEALQLVEAATVMPKSKFNEELNSMLGWLKERTLPVASEKPRLLVTSDQLDNPEYLELVEETGALVAMDDLDTGSRYFWDSIDGSASIDPLDALVKRYLSMSAAPRMFFWSRQIDQIIHWCKDFMIDGVLNLPARDSFPRHFKSPYLEKRLQEAEIPHATFLRDYHMSNAGQLRTRVGAFIETIPTKG